MPDKRRDLRPTIPTAPTTSNEAERFQNEVLRPILKMQNELLLAAFTHYCQKRKIPFSQLSPQKQLEQIEQSIQKDQRLRALLAGLLIGQFTVEEYRTYLTMESELKRRALQMAVVRLQDQMDKL